MCLQVVYTTPFQQRNKINQKHLMLNYPQCRPQPTTYLEKLKTYYIHCSRTVKLQNIQLVLLTQRPLACRKPMYNNIHLTKQPSVNTQHQSYILKNTRYQANGIALVQLNCAQRQLSDYYITKITVKLKTILHKNII